MVAAKPILQLTTGVQSVALLGRAVQLVPKKWNGKKKKPKKLIKGFVDITIGTGLLKAQSDIVNKM